MLKEVCAHPITNSFLCIIIYFLNTLLILDKIITKIYQKQQSSIEAIQQTPPTLYSLSSPANDNALNITSILTGKNQNSEHKPPARQPATRQKNILYVNKQSSGTE